MKKEFRMKNLTNKAENMTGDKLIGGMFGLGWSMFVGSIAGSFIGSTFGKSSEGSKLGGVLGAIAYIDTLGRDEENKEVAE